jgi:hypothetical protein
VDGPNGTLWVVPVDTVTDGGKVWPPKNEMNVNVCEGVPAAVR